MNYNCNLVNYLIVFIKGATLKYYLCIIQLVELNKYFLSCKINLIFVLFFRVAMETSSEDVAIFVVGNDQQGTWRLTADRQRLARVHPYFQVTNLNDQFFYY